MLESNWADLVNAFAVSSKAAVIYDLGVSCMFIVKTRIQKTYGFVRSIIHRSPVRSSILHCSPRRQVRDCGIAEQSHRPNDGICEISTDCSKILRDGIYNERPNIMGRSLVR